MRQIKIIITINDLTKEKRTELMEAIYNLNGNEDSHEIYIEATINEDGIKFE